MNLDGPTGLKFDGAGYASSDTHTYRFHDDVSISLKFKTFGEDGILFLIEHSPVRYSRFSVILIIVRFRINQFKPFRFK